MSTALAQINKMFNSITITADYCRLAQMPVTANSFAQKPI